MYFQKINCFDLLTPPQRVKGVSKDRKCVCMMPFSLICNMTQGFPLTFSMAGHHVPLGLEFRGH